MSRTPIHPGIILADELAELGMSAAEAARMLGVPANRITQILKGARNITSDTAYRLSLWLGTSAEFWLNLQNSYELRKLAQDSGQAIAKRVIPLSSHSVQPSL